MAQVSAPVSTTVVASEILPAAGASVPAAFAQFLAVARQLGYVSEDAGKGSLTLTLAPEAPVGSSLDALAKAAMAFAAASAPATLRSMAHFGVVFRTETSEGVSYVGSAVRATQSALRRAPPHAGFLATTDFSAFAAKQAGLPFQLRPLEGTPAGEGFNQIVFGAGGSPPAASGAGGASAPVAAGASGIDPAFVDFVKKRLAQDIGPFANALVDRAIRTVTAPDQLASLLGRDIENPAARKQFETDLLRFAKSLA